MPYSAHHAEDFTGLPHAADHPVHLPAGQDLVSPIGLAAYAGGKLCTDGAKEQTKEKPCLTSCRGALEYAAKAGTPCLEFLPLPHFARRRKTVQAVSRKAVTFRCCLPAFFSSLSRTFFCIAARLAEMERKSELTILFVTTA